MSDEIVMRVKVDSNGRLSDMEGNPLMVGPLSQEFILDSMMTASDGRRMTVRELIAEKQEKARASIVEGCGSEGHCGDRNALVDGVDDFTAFLEAEAKREADESAAAPGAEVD